MKYTIFTLTTVILLVVSCGLNKVSKVAITDSQTAPTRTDTLTDSTAMTQELKHKLDIVEYNYNEALKSLQNADTSSAEIFFNNANDIVSGFNEDENDEVQENPLYANILKLLDNDYHRLFKDQETSSEKDVVMEEIGEAENEVSMMPDSLSEKIEVVVDSSEHFPLVINPRVSAAMTYFQTKGRNVFSRWLQRSSRYKDLYTGILREENVPVEFFYLAMIESGFVNHAYSYARAAGPWQFMSGTGRMYGLRSSWWFDERRDPLKATRAAAKHLKSLYDYFDGNWTLAMAGYNVNPAKVRKRVRIQGTEDFWKLRHLPKQTLNYVPTFMAASIMAREPQKFGFTVEQEPPFDVDTVLVSEAIDLSLVAQWTDTSYTAIRDMNPAVLRWCTPPGVKKFSLNIPTGTKAAFREGLEQVPEKEKLSYIRYRIKGGDVLGLIAEKFHVSVSIIKNQNNLRGNNIYAGHYLIIPVPKDRQEYYAHYNYVPSKKRVRNRAPQSIEGRTKVIYEVKSGDTIGQIAEDYHIRASEIRQWNGISFRSIIRPGQKLTIFTPLTEAEAENAQKQPIELASIEKELKPGEVYYTIRRGDTLWDIAQKYNTTIEKLKERNGISSQIKPGEKLIISK